MPLVLVELHKLLQVSVINVSINIRRECGGKPGREVTMATFHLTRHCHLERGEREVSFTPSVLLVDFYFLLS